MEQDPEKKEALKIKLLEETFPFYFSRFDKMLQDNNGHFGSKVISVNKQILQKC